MRASFATISTATSPRGCCPSRCSASSGYRDLPATRGDDWHDLVRAADARLTVESEELTSAEDEGGVQQQRHPGLPEEAIARAEPVEQLKLLGLDQDDSDPVAESQAMSRARLSNVVRARAMNEGADRQPLLPSF